MGKDSRPIGIFDSGVGGLSVLRAIRELMPDEDLVYLADQGHAPYGPRPHTEIRKFSEAITRFLFAQNAKAIVVACNSASAAALKHLRELYPEVPVVGMEPAVKPATERSRSHVIGVLATSATFRGNLYRRLLEKFASGTKVLESACPGLVQAIENARLDEPETRKILEDAIAPMLRAGADTLVLGCTHYPFIKPLIEKMYGNRFELIDPAPAVARYLKQLLDAAAPEPKGTGKITLYTTGAVESIRKLLPQLIGPELEGTAAEIHPAKWTDALELRRADEPELSPA